MIEVIQERDNVYTVHLDVPETSILYKIAEGFSMKRTDALASCIMKGFDSCVVILHEIVAREQRDRDEAEGKG